MLGLTQEQIYWKSLQFAVHTQKKPVYSEEVDYRLVFFLATASLLSVVVLFKKLWLFNRALPIVVQPPKAILKEEQQGTKVICEKDLFQRVKEFDSLSKYLNIINVELEYVSRENIDRIARLEKILSICCGAGPDVKMFAEPLPVEKLFMKLRDAVKVWTDIKKYKSQNSNMVRLDLYIFINRTPTIAKILDDCKSIVIRLDSFRSHKNPKSVENKYSTFEDLHRNIKSIVLDLEKEKKDFQKKFLNKMKGSFRNFSKQFKLPKSFVR